MAVATEDIKKYLPEHYKKVLRLIPEGSAKPIQVSEIEKLTGFSSQRIRSCVSDSIITYGILVATSNVAGRSGYYFPETQEDIEATIANMNSRISYLSKRVQAFKNAPDPEQMDFDFLD